MRRAFKGRQGVDTRYVFRNEMKLLIPLIVSFLVGCLSKNTTDIAPVEAAVPTPTVAPELSQADAKPAIFLYPEREREITVRLSKTVREGFVYPPFNLSVTVHSPAS